MILDLMKFMLVVSCLMHPSSFIWDKDWLRMGCFEGITQPTSGVEARKEERKEKLKACIYIYYISSYR